MLEDTLEMVQMDMQIQVVGQLEEQIQQGGPTLGTIGVHTLLNGTVSNVTANLYGRAGFLTSETWRHGKVTMHNTNVNVYGKDNAVYYIMPAAFKTISKYTDSNYHLGAIQGETNVKNVWNRKYCVSIIRNFCGKINKKILEKWNWKELQIIVYSSFSYAPTWEVGVYGGKAGKMNSLIQFNQNVELYGDETQVYFLEVKLEEVQNLGKQLTEMLNQMQVI